MAAPVRSPSASPANRLYGRPRRPDELFSRDGPLGARADVRVVTSDGQELWLHRIVLEMWSELFRDLVSAAEEHTDAIDGSAVTIVLTDTAADIMLLLSCLYPASHHPDRPQGSTLDAPSCLPLLSLADKYHCPHIIHRCAGFALEHVLPRLAASAEPAKAAEYLQHRPTASSSSSSAPAPSSLAAASATASATAVADWVVCCLELAARLELAELAEEAARLLGRRFFDWELQAEAHRELMARAARVLAPEQFVDLVLRAIPPPGAAATAAVSASPTKAAASSPAARVGGGAAAGGPRIVPVVVAAAGPAAAVAAPQAPPQPVAAPPPPVAAAAPPLLAPQAAVAPPPQQQQAGPPQPFQEQFPPQHHQHHQQQQPQAFWQQAQPFWQHAAMHGGAGGVHGQPEPLLGPGHAGW